MPITRRRGLQLLAGLPAWGLLPGAFAEWSPSRSGNATPVAAATLAATWQQAHGYRLGLLAESADGVLNELAGIDLPTRAHGLQMDARGRLLVVARRPGDWLLQWSSGAAEPRWHWIEAGQAFNGHVLTHAGGDLICTTERDADTGEGRLAVRDARTLARLALWSTGGVDPHQLVWDRSSPHHVFIANGGIATRPETGRQKWNLDGMDSSLVRLDIRSGHLGGIWRLKDRRLSLRHLAWCGDCLGVALQAEHDDAQRRDAAPVLAVWDGRALRAAQAPQSLKGYGGDVAAHADGFVVSCPRADGLAQFDAQGVWRGFLPAPKACALAVDRQQNLWAAGHPLAWRLRRADTGMSSLGWSSRLASSSSPAAADRTTAAHGPFDNHWISLGQASSADAGWRPFDPITS